MAITKRDITLFVGIFTSVSLLSFGVIMAVLQLAPALIPLLATRVYQPQLPLSADAEVVPIEERIAGKQLYPALPSQTVPVEAGNWIRIPSIDVKVPLVLSASLSDEDVIKSLESGAALYPNGIAPGVLGNTFIAAHSTGNPWHGPYRFAFLRINELEPGNEIHLDYNGTRYTYRVDAKDIVIPTPDFRVVSDRPVPTMTLMACWPLWSTEKRMLVHAELSNVTKLTPRPI